MEVIPPVTKGFGHRPKIGASFGIPLLQKQIQNLILQNLALRLLGNAKIRRDIQQMRMRPEQIGTERMNC